jgi:hypothetical protein
VASEKEKKRETKEQRIRREENSVAPLPLFATRFFCNNDVKMLMTRVALKQITLDTNVDFYFSPI